MPNICLTISYDGTRYAGWQVQRNAKSVQEEIERILRKILKEKIRLIASGRTDSGVHAKAQVANFKTKRDFPLDKLRAALNSNLPRDISIVKIKNAPLKFHSQYDTKSKIYRYTILNGGIDDPFSRDYYHRVPYRLNVFLMRKEAKSLVGKHDFKSFQAKSTLSNIKNTIRTIKRITIKKNKHFVQIDIEADGFLYNMVRNIVGTLVEVARGHLPEGSTKKILLAKDRQKAGPTAPAKGLMLVKVALKRNVI